MWPKRPKKMRNGKCLGTYLHSTYLFESLYDQIQNPYVFIQEIKHVTMATVRHKSYISRGRNFNNILKYNVLSSNFGGYLKLLEVI